MRKHPRAGQAHTTRRRSPRLVRVAMACVLAVSALALAACGNGAIAQATRGASAATTGSDGNVIRIGFPSSGNSSASGLLGVAKAKGFLDEELKPLGYTAEVTGFTGAAPAIHEALASGSLDYVDYAGFAGILGTSKGIALTNLATTTYGSTWRLVASTSSGINSLADLKGKKVGYTRGASPHMYLLKVLQKGGLGFNDVEGVNAPLADNLSSLASGAIDATVVTAGQEQPLVDSGKAKVIDSGRDDDPATFFEPMNLVGRSDFVSSHKDVTVAVLKAYLKAKDWVLANPDEYFTLMEESTKNPAAVIRASVLDDLGENFPMSLDQRYLDSLSTIQDFEAENKLIDAKKDPSSWTDPSYLQEATKQYDEQK